MSDPDRPFENMLPPDADDEQPAQQEIRPKTDFQQIGKMKSFKEAYAAFQKLEAEQTATDAGSGSNRAECGELQMPLSESEMLPDVTYCCGLYHHKLTRPKMRTIRIEGVKEVIDTPNAKLTKFVVGECSQRHTRILKQQSEERVETASKQAKYRTVDGQPMTLENYIAQNATQTTTRIALMNFRPDAKVMITGKTGRGKTHLCRGLYMKLLFAGSDCQWWTAADLKDLIAKYKSANWHKDAPEERKFIADGIARLDACEVLFIDDLGTEPKGDSQFFEDFLKDYFERRRSGLVISSNLDEAGIKARYPNEKLISRLFMNLKVLTVEGEDYRGIKVRKS